MGWQKLVMLLVNIGFVKQNVNQVLLILFTKLVNCTFANATHCLVNIAHMFILHFLPVPLPGIYELGYETSQLQGLQTILNTT